MADRVGEMIKFITRRGGSRHVVLHTPHRPIDQQGAPNDIFPRHEAPIAAVEALIAIVAQHEIVALRNNQFAVLDQFSHLQPPPPLQPRDGIVSAGKLVPKYVMRQRAVTNVRFRQRSAVHVHSPVDQAYAISRHSHHALHEVFAGMNRIVENDDISAVDRAVGQDMIQKSTAAIAQLIHQQIIPDQQGVLHGLGGNLKSLDDKRDNKHRDDHSGQQRLQRNQPVRLWRFPHNG